MEEKHEVANKMIKSAVLGMMKDAMDIKESDWRQSFEY